MKKLCITASSIILVILTAYLHIKANKNIATMHYTNEQLFSRIKPSAVIATINADCVMYIGLNDHETRRTIPADTKVEIIQDRTALWYRVMLPETREVWWIEGKYLDIPADPPTNTYDMGASLTEEFVNAMDFDSDTDYFVWTDIDRQKTYVFNGKKNNWRLEKSFVCSTGINKTPTTRGLFRITDRGDWFYSDRLNSGGRYWVKFNGSYLFHSVAMDRNKNITDGVLGERRSSGCIRMSLDDIRWFYDNVKSGTKVFVH